MSYDDAQEKIDAAAIKFGWTDEEKRLVEELCDEQGDREADNALMSCEVL